MDSQKKAQQRYFQKMKNDPEYKANRNKNEKAKEYYKNNREKVLEKKKLKYSIIKNNDETNDSDTDIQ